MHPNIVAEIPGVELENYYDNISGPVLQLEKEPVKEMAQRAEPARENFGLGMNVHKTNDHIKGVDEVIEIDSDSNSD